MLLNDDDDETGTGKTRMYGHLVLKVNCVKIWLSIKEEFFWQGWHNKLAVV